MDNAACPLHIAADGGNLTDLADAAIISLHETKAIGRGEGGLLLVKPEFVDTAYRAVNFGYDPKVYITCSKPSHPSHAPSNDSHSKPIEEDERLISAVALPLL